MAVTSSNVLEYKHITKPTDEILEYMDSRRKGTFRSLRTRWAKLNNVLEGGFIPGQSTILAGTSGSGKSAFLNMIETDLIEYNQDLKPYLLCFSLEMLSSRQIGRKLSNKLEKSVQELYSGFAFLEGHALSDEEYQKAVDEAKKLKEHNIYYVDTPGSISEIKNTIDKFRTEVSKDNWLVITLDHTLLVKGKASDSEREVINELQQMFLQEKKIGKTTIIQLSQLNRDIESPDRILNANLHYPTRKDLSTSDQVYQTADYVFVISRPEIFGIKAYGQHGLPTENMIYLHCLKARDSEQKILKFKNDLKYNKITDILD